MEFDKKLLLTIVVILLNGANIILESCSKISRSKIVTNTQFYYMSILYVDYITICSRFDNFVSNDLKDTI